VVKILLAHQNFPGQFKNICRRLVTDPANELVFLSRPNQNRINGVRRIDYPVAREVAPGIHHYLAEGERGLLFGQGVVREVVKLRESGWKPDVMVGHNGWGETLFLKDVFPDVPLLSYFEFFYRAGEADVNFDPEYPLGFDDIFRLRIKNTINLWGLDAADWGLSPTVWQRSRYPAIYQPRISVIHEGVDTDIVKPDPGASIFINDTLKLTAEDEVITYVSRNLEPYRGFHIFMRTIPEILKRRPNAHIVIVGGDEVSYGRPHDSGRPYRQVMLEEVPVDLSRVHFTGKIAYGVYLQLLQVSSAHVYLTYPFVLSWSMMEAMAAGCLVIGSRTPPVEEVLVDRHNGLLVDFFSPVEIAECVDEVLSHPDRMRAIRQAARQTIVDRYDLETICLPQFLELIDDLIAHRPPRAFEQPVRPKRAMAV
jgi:glycosyltransferase involved in cell wall biosynthesis